MDGAALGSEQGSEVSTLRTSRLRQLTVRSSQYAPARGGVDALSDRGTSTRAAAVLRRAAYSSSRRANRPVSYNGGPPIVLGGQEFWRCPVVPGRQRGARSCSHWPQALRTLAAAQRHHAAAPTTHSVFGEPG